MFGAKHGHALNSPYVVSFCTSAPCGMTPADIIQRGRPVSLHYLSIEPGEADETIAAYGPEVWTPLWLSIGDSSGWRVGYASIGGRRYVKTTEPNGNQRFLDLFGFHESGNYVQGRIVEIKESLHTRLYVNEWGMVKPDVWNVNRHRHFIE